MQVQVLALVLEPAHRLLVMRERDALYVHVYNTAS